ncbi:hypothetical protein Tco_0655804 [Tanacetum coccineum]|uniref:Retrovirus-related Pol polyprotein from transposon TNT 1-94-like beta-barrel domain-containing protein n=1 Tax=Tanacetum coccineum TaxID=301880 RepID=A0ABQ4X702_9ASTR
MCLGLRKKYRLNLKNDMPPRDKALDFQITQLTDKVIVLQEQNKLFRTENAKIKQHYKELYDSIKITRAKHIEQTTTLLTENENLKAQIHENLKCITMDSVKPRVLATGRYAIDVEPIPPHNRNNREVHLDYLKHLKENVETLREIVEEDKVDRPLDSSLAFACLYTKHSQVLLEYVIGTCPKDFNQRDKNCAATPLTRKKQVTFEDQCETSNSNTHKHVEQLYIQKTNVFVPPSTEVNSYTDASGSQPRSNTKKNRILPAKSVNKKQVEEHPRTNKSSLKTTNRVDSSISSKRTVVQIVLWYLDSACSKHMMGDRSWLRNFVKKFIGTVRFGNDHYGAIMGYGYYVIGDSVISRVYYVEGLGHNLFSVGQFCDSDLEVAFRKHSCYVCDTDGVELIKGPEFLLGSEDVATELVFGALCYPINDSEDLGKLQPTADIGIFVGVTVNYPLMTGQSFCSIDNDHFINVFALEPRSEASSSGDLSSTEYPYVSQKHSSSREMSKIARWDNIIGNPSRPVSTKKQLGKTMPCGACINLCLVKSRTKNSQIGNKLKIDGFQPCKIRFHDLIDFKYGN